MVFCGQDEAFTCRLAPQRAYSGVSGQNANKPCSRPFHVFLDRMEIFTSCLPPTPTRGLTQVFQDEMPVGRFPGIFGQGLVTLL